MVAGEHAVVARHVEAGGRNQGAEAGEELVELLARVFALDITRCRTCGGRMRVLEVVSDPDAIALVNAGVRPL